MAAYDDIWLRSWARSWLHPMHIGALMLDFLRVNSAGHLWLHIWLHMDALMDAHIGTYVCMRFIMVASYAYRCTHGYMRFIMATYGCIWLHSWMHMDAY